MTLHAKLHSKETLGDRIMKVNHAGEHGAVNIYRGQLMLARFTAPEQSAVLEEFLAHECRHRAIFASELARRGQPRCRSYALCGLGGCVLGILTGMLGRRAIGATTFAVERVVLKHLQAQLATLGAKDAEAVEAIRDIMAEEAEHKDRYSDAQAGDRIWRALLLPVVAAATESVIWLGMRLRRPRFLERMLA
jgi:ubiquinone biosynthesis monooxygenase Coq7